MHILYVLDGKVAKQCDSLMEWAIEMGTCDRSVGFDEIGDIVISTAFLGVDYNHIGDDDPLLFETMVFWPDGNGRVMDRYFTWEEAAEGHMEILKVIKRETMIADFAMNELMEKIAR